MAFYDSALRRIKLSLWVGVQFRSWNDRSTLDGVVTHHQATLHQTHTLNSAVYSSNTCIAPLWKCWFLLLPVTVLLNFRHLFDGSISEYRYTDTKRII